MEDGFKLSVSGNWLRVCAYHCELLITKNTIQHEITFIVYFDLVDLPIIELTRWVHNKTSKRLVAFDDSEIYLDDFLFNAKGIFAPYSARFLATTPTRKFIDGNSFNLCRNNLWMKNIPYIKDEGTHISVSLGRGGRRFSLDYADFDLAFMSAREWNKSKILISNKSLQSIISARMGFLSPMLNYYDCNHRNNRRENLQPCQQMHKVWTGEYYVVVIRGLDLPIFVDNKDIDLLRAYTWFPPKKEQQFIHNEFGDTLCELIVERITDIKISLKHLDNNVFNNRRSNFLE